MAGWGWWGGAAGSTDGWQAPCWGQRCADAAARACSSHFTSFGAPGRFVYRVPRPLIPSYWVTGSRGFFWSALKRSFNSTQVQTLCFVVSFSQLCFPFCPPSFLSLFPFPHYCGKGRKGKKTLQKWKISLLYHKDELCNHFPLSKELKDNKSPN